MKIGDKVSFVNEKQDGIIVAIKSNGIIVVEIEDGFTLDVTAKELVKISSLQNKAKDYPTQSIDVKTINEPIFPINFIKDYNLFDQLAMVVVPDTGKVLSGGMNYHFINGTMNEVLFAFSLIKGKLIEGINSCHIKENSAIEIGNISRDQLIESDSILMECILFRKGNHGRFLRISKEITIELPTLFQHFPKLPSPWCFGLVHQLQNLISIDKPEDIKELMEKYSNEKNQVKTSKQNIINNPSKRNDQTLQQFGLSGLSLEVDLHIEEIIDNLDGLSNGEMLNIQINYFRKQLDKAIFAKISSIVFIHGVGNGRLKQEIRQELKSLNINFRDAAYEKFGSGATEVLLR